jgi:hypothetical protein
MATMALLVGLRRTKRRHSSLQCGWVFTTTHMHWHPAQISAPLLGDATRTMGLPSMCMLEPRPAYSILTISAPTFSGEPQPQNPKLKTKAIAPAATPVDPLLRFC